jgi:hypothetical protein
MNSYLREFLITAESRFDSDSSTTSMSEWIIKNTRHRKKPFSFEGFEFQRRIVDDMHPDLCVIKISQVGLTEVQLRKNLGFLRRNTAVTSIFTMPTDTMRDRVSQTRAKPLIDSEPVFNPPNTDKPIRQKGLYQIGDSFGYFTGSTEGDATSIPADMLLHDEIDLTDQQMIGLFQSRLQASRFKIRQAFSTPTFHGYGIDSLYSVSDQHEYLYRCPGCRQHQIPEFAPRFLALPGLNSDQSDLSLLSPDEIAMIDFDKAHWRCGNCSKPLDLTDASLREWVATYPGRRSRGYRVRPTSVATITPSYIFQQLIRYQAAGNLKGFHNTVLGEPFNDSNARLSETEIRAVMTGPAVPEIPFYVPCFLGIDVGIVCSLILATADTTVLFEQVPQNKILDRVAELHSRYTIVSGCIDRYPYTPLSEQLRDAHPGIVMPIHYATAPNSAPLKEVKDEFDVVTHWSAHRTKTLDTVVARVRSGKFKLAGYGSLQNVVINHLRDMVRIEQPDVPPVWNKIKGEDHFFHAMGYMFLSNRLRDAQLYSSESERRSNIILFGVNALQGADLSPNGLNKRLGGELGSWHSSTVF